MQRAVKHRQIPVPLAHISALTDPFSSGHWSVVDEEDDDIGDPSVNGVLSGLGAGQKLVSGKSGLDSSHPSGRLVFMAGLRAVLALLRAGSGNKSSICDSGSQSRSP